MMARIGGRSAWLAWPVGVVCLVVVAVLLWLALPMAPVIADWGGSALRGELGGDGSLDAPTASPVPEEETAPETVTADPPTAPTSCENLYPAYLWTALTSTPGATLTEGASYPADAFAGLPDALGATMTVGCAWSMPGGATIVTTLAETPPDAATTVFGVLGGAGFWCESFRDGVVCAREADEAGGVPAETHILADGRWLTTVRTEWEPADYDSALRTRIWSA